MGDASFFGLTGMSIAVEGELQDPTRVRYELVWFALRVSPPLRWGCYVLSAYRRSTDDLLRQEWRLEITLEDAEPNVDRLVNGGPGSIVRSPVYRSYPPALDDSARIVIEPSTD